MYRRTANLEMVMNRAEKDLMLSRQTLMGNILSPTLLRYRNITVDSAVKAVGKQSPPTLHLWEQART